MLSTHRLLQLANLADSCASKARRYRRCAARAAQAGRKAQWVYFFGKACRCEQIVLRCQARGVQL